MGATNSREVIVACKGFLYPPRQSQGRVMDGEASGDGGPDCIWGPAPATRDWGSSREKKSTFYSWFGKFLWALIFLSAGSLRGH